jgi:hypothetical protein
MTTIASAVDGKYTRYEFEAGGYDFKVLYSPTAGGYWTVYREPKGAQLNKYGKTFWKAAAMVDAYKTARAPLQTIADARGALL